MTQHVCEFCDASFAQKYTLTRHIKGSKKCIASRGNGTPLGYLKCICGYTTGRTDTLVDHKKICIKTVRAEAQTPPVVNITNINNINNNNNNFYGDVTFNNSYYRQYVIDNFESISNQLLDEAAGTLKLGDIQSGGKGLARHSKKYINDLIILDHPRKKGLYKNEIGEALVDDHLSKLTTRVAKAYHPPAIALYKEWISKPLDSYQMPLAKQTAQCVAWLNRFGNGGEGGDTRQDRVFENDYKNELAIGYSRDDFRIRVGRNEEPAPPVEGCELVNEEYDRYCPTPSEDTCQFIEYAARQMAKQSSSMDRYRQMCDDRG
jgi:hypothetical protein